MFAAHVEVLGMEPQPDGIVVHPTAARAPAAVKAVTDGIAAAVEHRPAGPLVAARPDLRADQIGHGTGRARLQHDHLFPRPGKPCRGDAGGDAAAYDYRVDRFVIHLLKALS